MQEGAGKARLEAEATQGIPYLPSPPLSSPPLKLMLLLLAPTRCCHLLGSLPCLLRHATCNYLLHTNEHGERESLVSTRVLVAPVISQPSSCTGHPSQRLPVEHPLNYATVRPSVSPHHMSCCYGLERIKRSPHSLKPSLPPPQNLKAAV
jgi:hypothetical protein